MATSARAPHGSNLPPKIIVKKIFIEGGGGHHGGAWKVAYADFVTAMMAFFLLLWLLGATTEKQRKGIADYFAPTLVETRSLGLGGSAQSAEQTPAPSASRSELNGVSNMPYLARPDYDPGGGPRVGTGEKGSLNNRQITIEDKKNFEAMRRQVLARMAANRDLAKLSSHVRFVLTREGMRIDLVDDANYSMFALGTTQLVPAADELIGLVASSIKGTGNPIMVRGHTDSLGYGNPLDMNNWMLSTGRAEATRRRLAASGIPEARFDRIEGVADREPLVKENPADPRNRRVAITLLWRAGTFREE